MAGIVEIKSDMAKSNNYIHGMHKTKEHKTWVGMKQRCFNSNAKKYDIYGGRGITVCDRWIEPKIGFVNFIEDIGLAPSLRHTLERIDVNGHYCKENCKWATYLEQNRNRRTTLIKEYKGVSKTVKEWADEFSLTYKLVKERLYRGWTFEDAISIPKMMKWERYKNIDNGTQETF